MFVTMVNKCTVRSVPLLLVTTNVVPNLPILVTLIMDAVSSSEMSVLTRAIRCNIQEDGILHSYRRENLIFLIRSIRSIRSVILSGFCYNICILSEMRIPASIAIRTLLLLSMLLPIYP
jgi:hypothetical protein